MAAAAKRETISYRMFWCFLLILQNTQMVKPHEENDPKRSIFQQEILRAKMMAEMQEKKWMFVICQVIFIMP